MEYIEYFVYQIKAGKRILVYKSFDRLNAWKFAFNRGVDADWELQVYDSNGAYIYSSYEDWLPF